MSKDYIRTTNFLDMLYHDNHDSTGSADEDQEELANAKPMDLYQ